MLIAFCTSSFALTLPDWVGEYKWDAVQTRQNFIKSEYFSSEPFYYYMIKNDNINAFFSNQELVNSIWSNEKYIRKFFEVMTDGSIENGELYRINFRPKHMFLDLCFRLSDDQKDQFMLTTRVGDASLRMMTDLLDSLFIKHNFEN